MPSIMECPCLLTFLKVFLVDSRSVFACSREFATKLFPISERLRATNSPGAMSVSGVYSQDT